MDSPPNEETHQAGNRGNQAAAPGVPRWVKVFSVVGLVLIVLLLALVLFGPDSFGPGQHGPGRHAPAGGGKPMPAEHQR